MKPSDLVLDQLTQQIFAAVMCEADLGSAPGGPAGANDRNQSEEQDQQTQTQTYPGEEDQSRSLHRETRQETD